MFPQSLASEDSFSFTMRDEYATVQIESSALPGSDGNETAVLLSYGL